MTGTVGKDKPEDTPIDEDETLSPDDTDDGVQDNDDLDTGASDDDESDEDEVED